MKNEGLEEAIPEGTGWHKTRAFGHVAFARHQRGPYDETGKTVLWLAVRIGNVPLGIAFRSEGAWAMLDVVVEDDPTPTGVEALAAQSGRSGVRRGLRPPDP